MPMEPKGVIRIWAEQKGLNTKIYLAVDAYGIPVRIFITQSTTVDCTQAGRLIEGISADYLLADMEIVIPPRKNRKMQSSYDKELYKLRYLVENAFLHLKG